MPSLAENTYCSIGARHRMNDDPQIVGFRRRKLPTRKWSAVSGSRAERLARLTPGEWQLWIDNSAAQLDIPRAS